ncbi:MAG: EthD family reductase [Syntrophaceae bacterium]|nr:EthD family reductase [Syntrophaceae bacterium]
MIKVSVFYPNEEGKRFDMDYYVNKHMPMIRQMLGTACKCVDAEQGLGGLSPGTPATYIAICHLYFESIESFQTAFGLHGQAIMADMPNYTNIQPTIQISEVKI